MELSYWQSRWQKGNTGWHMDTVYPVLPKIWPQLNIPSGARIFVPLCGKSLDLQWLIDQNCTVIGVDISKKALHSIMQQHSEPFEQEASHGFTIYRSEAMTLWEGDVMKLPNDRMPPIDLIYDKAAIVALPPNMRSDYAQKLLSLCSDHTQILMQTFEYIQEEMNGPPFSVDEQELEKLFGKQFSRHLLHEQSKLKELKGFRQRGLSSHLKEKVYQLTPSDGK